MKDRTRGDVPSAGREVKARPDVETAAEEAGVDLATIRERLRMTPAERLAANTRGWRLVQLFRRAGNEERTDAPSRS